MSACLDLDIEALLTVPHFDSASVALPPERLLELIVHRHLHLQG